MRAPGPDLRGHTVLFLHAHPDDEAIFSGLTLRRLADAGARTVLVLATAGELGGSRVPLRVAEIADDEGAATIVHDDEHGIYGHPDHAAAHRVGALAAELTGAAAYRTTVDREHLHVAARDRHLVHGAARATATGFGRATVEIALAVTGTPAHLDVKRAAITAHESQLAPEQVPADGFAAAYGHEWYRRSGPPGVLDLLGNSHLLAGAIPKSNSTYGTDHRRHTGRT